VKAIKMSALKIVFLFIISLLAIFNQCRKNATGLSDIRIDTFSLKVETIGTQFTELKLTIDAEFSHPLFAIKRNGQTIVKDTLFNKDTTIYDDHLAAQSAYQYKAYLYFNNKPYDSTDAVSIRTLNATSHDFTWHLDTIGVYGSAFLDVAVLNEHNVWAVGWIETGDTTVGAEVWDGQNWRVQYLSINKLPCVPLQGIWPFSDNNIWFTGGSIFHWNGDSNSISYFRDFHNNEMLHKIWGSSPNDIYAIGYRGVIMHYDGQKWEHQYSGTKEDLYMVRGIYDPEIGRERVWVCGDHTLLYNEGHGWKTVWSREKPLFEDYDTPRGIYLPNHKKIIVSANGRLGSCLYMLDQKNLNNKYFLAKTTTYTYGMDGHGFNDIFIVGADNYIEHYNGLNIKLYENVIVPGFANGVKLYHNNLYVVGSTQYTYQALFIYGERK